MRLLLLFSCLFYLNLAFSQDCESPKGKTKRICNNASKLIKKGKYYKPMKDKIILNKLIDKLDKKKYSHYELPGSLKIKL